MLLIRIRKYNTIKNINTLYKGNSFLFTNYIYHIYLLWVVCTGSPIVSMLKLILVPVAYYHIYIYIYIYTILPVNAIVRIPHPRNGDSQDQETFLGPSADNQTRICIYMHLYVYTYIYIYINIYVYVYASI